MFEKDPSTNTTSFFLPPQKHKPSFPPVPLFPEDSRDCPFCYKDSAPHEVIKALPSLENWQVISILNKYPMLPPDPVPRHEVLILSPFHFEYLAQLSVSHSSLILELIQERLEHYLALDLYPVSFINHGQLAGASQPHPHAQVLAFSEPTPHMLLQEKEASDCSLCTLPSDLIIYRDQEVLIFTPAAPATSFELRISTINHTPWFNSSAAAPVLTTALAKLEEVFGPFAYNVLFNLGSSPHANIRILPRLNPPSGLFYQTGITPIGAQPLEVAQYMKLLFS